MITLKHHSDEPRNWKSLGASTIAHMAGLLILLSLPSSVTRSLILTHPSTTKLILPVLESPPAVVELKPVAPIIARTFPPPKPIPVPVINQSIEPPVPPPTKPEPIPIRETPRIAPPPPKPQSPSPSTVTRPAVHTGVLAAAISEPVHNSPPKLVQQGGFGEPIGTAVSNVAPSKMSLPAVGSFDLPSGPGRGSGADGVKGEPRLIASSGFGSTVAQDKPKEQRMVRQVGFGNTITSEDALTPKREVRADTFGDVAVAAPVAAKPKPVAAPTTPVEILFKPKPVYTDEARVARLQGEVCLRVLFSGNRTLKLLGIARSLGHGLDEAAIQALQQIQFNPAVRDGAPVDSTAIVRFVFQLAE